MILWKHKIADKKNDWGQEAAQEEMFNQSEEVFSW